MRNEYERDKQRDDLLVSTNRRRRTGLIISHKNQNLHSIYLWFLEQDRLQLEQEYLLQQQMLSKSATLNEVILFKNEFEKSERQREQLSDHLEVLLIIKSVYKKYAFSIDFRC